MRETDFDTEVKNLDNLILNSIDDFINRNPGSGRKEKEIREKLFVSLKENYYYCPEQGDDIGKAIAFAIAETVKGYKKSKDSAIQIFKEYVKYVNQDVDRYSLNLNVSFPPIPVSNKFERLMYIAKEIQVPEKSCADIAESLWISEESIVNDLRSLRGKNTENISVLGQPFVIDMDRRGGKFYMASSVHPLFLSENLLQFIVMLRGLKYMCEEPCVKIYSLETATCIWHQLSDYAKMKIISYRGFSDDEQRWCKVLEERSPMSTFIKEYDQKPYDSHHSISHCYKSDVGCDIGFENGEGEIEHLCNCKIAGVENGCIKLRIEDEERIIHRNSIMYSRVSKI